MKHIGTHDGQFHADEAFACALLQMTDCYADSDITRSRDPEILKNMDVLVDVGGVYDPATNRYDHHQPTFHDTFSPEHKTLLSSAGLVYKHFGREIISKWLVDEGKNSSSTIESLYQKLYDSFVEPFDANDNGISAYPAIVKPLFQKPWDIFSQVNILNPNWNESNVDVSSRFHQAVALVRNNFEAVLKRTINSWLPARDILKNSLVAKTLTSSSNLSDNDERLLVLERNCPWKEHLFELEKALSITNPILYVLYKESSDESWRIQAVPQAPDTFECRRALPESWRGLRNKELDNVSGIDGCVFVHRSGFIGGHSTKSGAILMAIKALQ